MRIETDRARAHLVGVLDALEAPGPDHQLLVLEAKAAAAEAALDGHRPRDARLRRRRVQQGLGLERLFRDARAASVMAPTTDMPTISSAGRCAGWSCSDDPALVVGAVLYDPKVSVIWEIIRDFFEAHGLPDGRRPSTATTSGR